MEKIIKEIELKKFYKLFYRKAHWEKPLLHNKEKIIKFFLKKGGTETMVRPNRTRNLFWKYTDSEKQLKYYFSKFFVISQKLKEKELQTMSNKWQVEERDL
jgi:hypothetical protein